MNEYNFLLNYGQWSMAIIIQSKPSRIQSSTKANEKYGDLGLGGLLVLIMFVKLVNPIPIRALH